jgi:hypothetical protein
MTSGSSDPEVEEGSHGAVKHEPANQLVQVRRQVHGTRHPGWMLVASAGIVVLFSGCGASGGAASATSTRAPTPTATPSPTSTPSSATSVSFQDPLTSNQNGWPDNGTQSFFKSDGYHLTAPVICAAPIVAFQDGAISVQTRQISGSLTQGYSLIFRFDESNASFYALLIDSNAYWRALKVAGNQPTFFGPWTANGAIRRGLNTTNTMKVSVQGTHFDFYVNGTKVGQADDSALTSGKAGLWGNTGIEVVYTNFNITP